MWFSVVPLLLFVLLHGGGWCHCFKRYIDIDQCLFISSSWLTKYSQTLPDTGISKFSKLEKPDLSSFNTELSGVSYVYQY